MSWFSKIRAPKPLLDAVMSGSIKDVEARIRAGEDVNAPVEEGQSYLLHYAVHSGVAMVELLLERGASPNQRAPRSKGNTPLHIAAKSGYADITLRLLAAGAEVNATNFAGYTPLFLAMAGPTALQHIAAAAGVPPSPEMLAEAAGRKAVVSLLKVNGATLSDIDRRRALALGRTPEPIRQSIHRTAAYASGDLEYAEALDSVAAEFDFLSEAYETLLATGPSTDQQARFLAAYEFYERNGEA